MAMEDVFEGRWKQIKGDLKRFWGNLTDDDLDVAEGNRDKLVGALAGAVRLGEEPRPGRVRPLPRVDPHPGPRGPRLTILFPGGGARDGAAAGP